eukprot:4063852-Alexandrium_andersonii.AAC.1
MRADERLYLRHPSWAEPTESNIEWPWPACLAVPWPRVVLDIKARTESIVLAGCFLVRHFRPPSWL